MQQLTFLSRISVVFIFILTGFVGLSMTERKVDTHFDIIKNIEIFTNLYKELNTNYVDELDPGQLMRTGIEAMLKSLDPYTNYFAESDIEKYRIMSEGKYRGIGAKLRKHNDEIIVTEPYAESPAIRAGLRAGDVVLKIDGRSTEGRSVEEVSVLLEGFPNSTVDLEVQREGQNDPITISLIRGEVSVPNVPYYGMVSDQTGYIALTTFTRNAGRNVQNALRDLRRDNPDIGSIILDLRGNGGGLLSEAVNVVNTFVPKGEMVVSMRGKIKERDRSFKTQMPSVDEDIPVVVLLDDGSASASEIVSGALQDLDRAVLMGQRSFGKGLVQNTKDIGYNSQLKLTTAKYYIPSGRCIQSVKYEDGEPVHIPDEERAEFRTRGGRKVLDGGGVKPEVLLVAPTDEPVVEALMKDMQIFDFATNYFYKQDSVQSPFDFWFDDFDAFLAFLNENNFKYVSPAEKSLDKFAKAIKDEAQQKAIANELKSIRSRLTKDQQEELMNNKEAILRLVNKEIVSRYHYQRGRVQNGLQNDPEIQEAVKLLQDTKRYEKLLK